MCHIEQKQQMIK